MSKRPQAYRTISEVSEELGLAQHVLRYWETQFPQLRPIKGAGGRRRYRIEDVALLRVIQHVVHDQGLPLREARSKLRDGSAQQLMAEMLADELAEEQGAQATARPSPPAPERETALETVEAEAGPLEGVPEDSEASPSGHDTAPDAEPDAEPANPANDEQERPEDAPDEESMRMESLMDRPEAAEPGDDAPTPDDKSLLNETYWDQDLPQGVVGLSADRAQFARAKRLAVVHLARATERAIAKRNDH